MPGPYLLAHRRPPRGPAALRRAALGTVAWLGMAVGAPTGAQAPAKAAWDSALLAAAQGDEGTASRLLARLAQASRASGDRALAQAATRGTAALWELRGCADSAERVLRGAVAEAPPGERGSADALVRLLAQTGRPAEARAVLVRAYGMVDGVGRTVTRESIGFLQGLAAVDRADGHEASALASLQSALALAERLEHGDVTDMPPASTLAATPLTAWVLLDVAILRQEARSPGVASPREAARLLAALAAAPGVLDGDPEGQLVARLGDRRLVQEAACRAGGRPCPPPVPKRGC